MMEAGMSGYVSKEDMPPATQEANRMEVTVAGGKYTFILRHDYSSTALRYGEPWPAFEHSSPDNFHSALAYEVDALRTGLQQIVDRSNNGEPGTSKVIDMRNIALSLLAQHGGPNA